MIRSIRIMVWERIVQPGDTIVVHAGVYQADRDHYTDPTGLVSDGTYWLTAKGTPEEPIVIKAAGDGEVIFDGAGADVLFNVMAADYHIFEGLTFRNCGYALFTGQQRVTGCVGLTESNASRRPSRSQHGESVKRSTFVVSMESSR